jgi:pimeloyl-ACP methyl ester carboxylesterase
VEASIGAPAHWRAALGYYRAVVRNTKVPEQYAELHRHWLAAPQIPTLYLHGRDDGCATADYAHWVEKILPGDSEVAIIERAGHFLQLERPDVVGRRIAEFIGQPG